MKTTLSFVSIVAALLFSGLWSSAALAGRAASAVADPTCAVIEQAEYDAETRRINIRGRSTGPVTLTVLDETGGEALITARRDFGGQWAVEFDIVDPSDVPGLVRVEGEAACVATRKLKTGSLATLSDPFADLGGGVVN